MRSMRTRVAMMFVVLVGVLFAFVFPTRAYVEQRGQVHAAETHLAVLKQQGAILRREQQRLQSDAEVERIARSRYNLVKPGEQAYAIVPSAPAPAAPATNASRAPHKSAKNLAWYRRVWHSITSIL